MPRPRQRDSERSKARGAPELPKRLAHIATPVVENAHAAVFRHSHEPSGSMQQADARETPPHGVRSRAWIGRAAFEAAIIVFGLVGALLIDEWRDTRERNERVRAALASIHAELEANRAALKSAIANHETVIARLHESAKTGVAYVGGIIKAAPFSAVAWDAARDAGITNDLDHATLMAIGHAYRALADYIAERTVSTNYIYTNDTPELRRRPLALAGWLSDMKGHAPRRREVVRRGDARPGAVARGSPAIVTGARAQR